jgi:hypothetical protein
MPHDLMTRCEQKKEFRRTSGDYWKWVDVSASEAAAIEVMLFQRCPLEPAFCKAPSLRRLTPILFHRSKGSRCHA